MYDIISSISVLLALGMSLLCRHNFEHNRWGKESGNILELLGKFSEYPGIIGKFQE